MQRTTQTSSWAGEDIASAVTRLEKQWAAAAKANDSAKIAPLLAEVFVDMDSDGTIHRKSQVLDRVKAEKWETFELSDIKVVVTGNIAIVNGVWHGKGTLADGKAVDAHERWLDTWHKNGKWQCMASASAPIQA